MAYSRRMLVLPIQSQPRVRSLPLTLYCLLIPSHRKHLIVSIGSECYVTLPKGQIIPTQSNAVGNNSSISTVPGGGHVLIVPIAHHPTYNTIPADIAPPILEETDKYVFSFLFPFLPTLESDSYSIDTSLLSVLSSPPTTRVPYSSKLDV
jgi:hypothetical protein